VASWRLCQAAAEKSGPNPPAPPLGQPCRGEKLLFGVVDFEAGRAGKDFSSQSRLYRRKLADTGACGDTAVEPGAHADGGKTPFLPPFPMRSRELCSRSGLIALSGVQWVDTVCHWSEPDSQYNFSESVIQILMQGGESGSQTAAFSADLAGLMMAFDHKSRSHAQALQGP